MNDVNKCLICQNKTTEIKHICDGCFDLILHPKFDCSKCAVELQSNHEICGHCQICMPDFDRVLYAGIYQSPLDSWVKAFKFSNKIILSQLFAALLKRQLTARFADYDLVPVPLHISRLRQRGYNQAYELSKEIAKITGIKLNPCLKRTKNTQMQAQLKLKERAANIAKAFEAVETPAKNILLIDDVMTSGNTLNECAKTLKKAGAETVCVLVIARKSL